MKCTSTAISRSIFEEVAWLYFMVDVFYNGDRFAEIVFVCYAVDILFGFVLCFGFAHFSTIAAIRMHIIIL